MSSHQQSCLSRVEAGSGQVTALSLSVHRDPELDLTHVTYVHCTSIAGTEILEVSPALLQPINQGGKIIWYSIFYHHRGPLG